MGEARKVEVEDFGDALVHEVSIDRIRLAFEHFELHFNSESYLDRVRASRLHTNPASHDRQVGRAVKEPKLHKTSIRTFS